MKIKATKIIQVEAKTLSIYMKVSDRFSAQLKDQNNEVLKDYDGYVPDFMPRQANGSSNYGDYLILDIDIDTGKIMNWRIPTAEQIETFIEGDNE